MSRETSPDSFDEDLTSSIIEGLLEIADDENALEEGAQVRINIESDE